MPKIRVSLLSLILIPMVICDPSGRILATVIAALLHEAGHIAVMMFLKIGISDVCITPYGLEIGTKRSYRSFGEEIAVNCAGCIVNFITFFAFSRFTGYIEAIASASLLLGILNAFPVLNLDGGETLFAVFSSFCSHRTAVRLSRYISFITLVLLWIIAVYIFLFSGYNYTLFIMTVWLFGKIYCG